MPIPRLDPVTGWPPLGRFGCTIAEFEAEFVNPEWAKASATRQAIWGEFWTATKLLLESTSPSLTHSAWIGGSFASSKLDPDDIDVTYLLDGRSYDNLSTSKRRRLDTFSQKDALRNKTGLRVEPFVLITRLVIAPEKGTAEENTYFLLRGNWDDHWQRCRTSPDKSDPRTLDDARPRRGYLEVTW